MSLEDQVETLELDVDALCLTVELLIGLLAQTDREALEELRAILIRRWQAEAGRPEAAPSSRAWRLLGRAIERLDNGMCQTPAERLAELFDH